MIIDENTIDVKEIFKKRIVEDYSGYIEGDYEASLGKIIKTLIVASESFIVYIDQENSVEWSYNNNYEGSNTFLEKFSIIVNKIGLLEELSKGKFKKQEEMDAFRRLLGESMGRLLNEKNDKNALVILDSAEQLLNSYSRQTLIKFASISALIILILEIFLWLNHKNLWNLLNWLDGLYYPIFFSLSGGIGGFIFLMIRSKKLEIEPSLDEYLYKWEGVLRVIYGIISAFIVYLGIKTKLIFGNIDQNSAHLILLICLLSGASEKIIPSIIKKIEDKL
jgi:hypothetical protein